MLYLTKITTNNFIFVFILFMFILVILINRAIITSHPHYGARSCDRSWCARVKLLGVLLINLCKIYYTTNILQRSRCHARNNQFVEERLERGYRRRLHVMVGMSRVHQLCEYECGDECGDEPYAPK